MTMLLSVKQAAEQLGISQSKCYELCACRKMSHYKIDGTIRISEQQIQEFLAGCFVGTSQPPVPTQKIRLKHLKN